jgi:hypothetical protein
LIEEYGFTLRSGRIDDQRKRVEADSEIERIGLKESEYDDAEADLVMPCQP